VRPCSAALKAFLEGPAREAVQIDLYTLVLVTGEVFRWSAGNSELVVPAAGFPDISINAGTTCRFLLGPGFGRSMITAKLGVEASDLDVTVYPTGDDGAWYSIAEMVRLGLLDGATVELDKLFATVSGSGLDTSMGVLVWFRGRVADAEVGRSEVKLKAKSVLNRLSTTQFPRRLYASSCSHVFGAPMCGYDRVAGLNALGEATGWGAVTITALAGSSRTQILASYVPALTPSPYIEGTVTGVTGVNAGAARTIRWNQDGIVYVVHPFLAVPAAGDTFTLLPGCSHSAEMCADYYNNIGRYGGFSHIPPPESAI
jgi:hypothetical protein